MTDSPFISAEGRAPYGDAPHEPGPVPVRYILKPLGATTPTPDLMPDSWSVGANLESYRVITGPNDPRKYPDITKPMTVVLHGVGFTRVFAIGEMLKLPEWDSSHRYGDRWPWFFRIRIDLMVSQISDGPSTKPLVSKAAMGKVQVGGEFAKLDRGDFEKVRAALLESPGCLYRPRPTEESPND